MLFGARPTQPIQPHPTPAQAAVLNYLYASRHNFTFTIVRPTPGRLMGDGTYAVLNPADT